jgi:uncharacterized membrane protein YdfJ with MMPL/SSD domain
VTRSGPTAIINVIPTTSPSAAETEDLVNRIRDDVLAGQPEPTYVVGTTAGYVDFTEKVAGRMLWLIGAVVLLAFLLLTVAFRSLLIGVKAAILNLLSVGAAVGMAVAVLIDASIVRMILVPSVMTLLGDRAWWLPRWLDRIVPDIQLEGGAPTPPPEPKPRETSPV